MLKIFQYEITNMVRSRWLLSNFVSYFFLSLVFIRLSGNLDKAVISLFSVLSVLVPLTSAIYSGIYWYYSDRFTQLILTMPVKRSSLFWSRWLALSSSLVLSMFGGVVLAFLVCNSYSSGLLLACGLIVLLIFIFVSLGLLLALFCPDRVMGVGLILGVWLYFVVVHDGLLLIGLIFFKNYPLEIPSVLLGALNPIGLARIVLILFYDAPLLLSQTGAIVRRSLTSYEAYFIGLLVATIWVALPAYWGSRKFRRLDF